MDSFEFDKLRRTVKYALKYFEWEREREKKEDLLYVQSHFGDDDVSPALVSCLQQVAVVL